VGSSKIRTCSTGNWHTTQPVSVGFKAVYRYGQHQRLLDGGVRRSSFSISSVRNHCPTCSKETICPSISGKKPEFSNPAFEATENRGRSWVETAIAHSLPYYHFILRGILDIYQTGNQGGLTQLMNKPGKLTVSGCCVTGFQRATSVTSAKINCVGTKSEP